MKSIFITATDTEVGKTTIASGILTMMASTDKNYKVVGFKPIAAGCEWLDGQWKNEDALALQQASNLDLNYSLVNPFALKSPIAPHIAAEQDDIRICSTTLSQYFEHFKSTLADLVVVEGAGGWQLPINETEYLSDWVVSQKLPVVLVVGLKLGCINHALLTAMAIKQAGAQLIGWVGNHVDPDMLCQSENIKSLQHRLGAPCLGIVPHLNPEQSASEFLDFNLLEKNIFNPA